MLFPFVPKLTLWNSTFNLSDFQCRNKLVQNIEVRQAQILAKKQPQTQQQEQSLLQKKDRGPGEDLDQGYDRGLGLGR